MIRSFALLALLDATAKGLAFLAAVLVARTFGDESFGALGLAQSLMAYGLTASACGLDVYAVKHGVAFESRLPRIAGTVIVLRLVLGAVAYGALLLVAAAAPPLREVFPLVAWFGLTLFTGAVSVAWVPQAVQRTRALGVSLLATQAVYLGLILLAIAMELGVDSVPVALVAGEAVAAGGLLVWMARTVGRPQAPLPPREALAFLKQAAPIGGAQLLRAAAMSSDLVIVGMFLSLEEAGWYSGAMRIFLLGVGAIALYFVLLYPRLALQATRSRAAVSREMSHSLKRTLPFALLGTGAGLVATPWILGVLFPPSYAAAEAPLGWLLVALIAFTVNGHLRNTLLALGRQRTDLGIVGASAAVHVGAKLALVPALGITGAALGMLAGETALLALSAVAVRRALSEQA